jgi:type II secretory pathway pseudopilin PulG
LVELLVVIAIIGTLVAVLLPAIQSARESARRSQCGNNLKQLVLAMHEFEDVYNTLPPGYVSHSMTAIAERDPVTWDAPPGWGWGAYLLPFLEEGNISDRIDFELPLWEPAYGELIRTSIPTFFCPSVSGERDPFTVLDEHHEPLRMAGEEVALARSHYAASHGQESCWDEVAADAPGVIFTNIYTSETKPVIAAGEVSRVADGPFFRNSFTRLSRITDGLSKTVFLGEHSSALSDKTWVGIVPGAFTHPRLISPENGPEHAATLLLCHGGPAGGELDITGFPIIHPINFPTHHVCQMFAEHPGGGQICLGDGSVRFVDENVDLILWAELSSMNEGEIIEEDF